MSWGDRFKRMWSAFRNETPPSAGTVSYYDLPVRSMFKVQNARSIVAAVYTKIAIDVSQLNFVHAKLDEEGQYKETVKDSLSDCLGYEANLDQTGRAFIHDAVASLLDEGVIALVPVRMKISPNKQGMHVFRELRTAKILQWYPKHIQVRAYNQETGKQEDFYIEKRFCAIVQNPFYSVMNEKNSTYSRLVDKMNLLDRIDRKNASGKLDMLIQVPYSTNNRLQQERSERRLKSIDEQLSMTDRGIAYIDGVERVVQLNRPIESNLQSQVEYLMTTFYNQLGVSEEVFKGTADEQTTLNYTNTVIRPIATAIAEAMTKGFLSKTARTQGHAVVFLSDPFKLVPLGQIADIADKFIRGEILTPNELRAIVGRKPSDDPRSNELRNTNLNASNDQIPRTLLNETEGEVENEEWEE